jgi:hypothetical protein
MTYDTEIAWHREQIANNRPLLEELEEGNTAGGDVFPETQSEIDHLKAHIAQSELIVAARNCIDAFELRDFRLSAMRQARSLASIICTSEASIDAFLQLGLAEAKSLIGQHRAAVLAIAEALMIHRTLDGAMIDTIISRAPERARRADWRHCERNAAKFLEGMA